MAPRLHSCILGFFSFVWPHYVRILHVGHTRSCSASHGDAVSEAIQVVQLQRQVGIICQELIAMVASALPAPDFHLEQHGATWSNCRLCRPHCHGFLFLMFCQEFLQGIAHGPHETYTETVNIVNIVNIRKLYIGVVGAVHQVIGWKGPLKNLEVYVGGKGKGFCSQINGSNPPESRALPILWPSSSTCHPLYTAPQHDFHDHEWLVHTGGPHGQASCQTPPQS